MDFFFLSKGALTEKCIDIFLSSRQWPRPHCNWSPLCSGQEYWLVFDFLQWIWKIMRKTAWCWTPHGLKFKCKDIEGLIFSEDWFFNLFMRKWLLVYLFLELNKRLPFRLPRSRASVVLLIKIAPIVPTPSKTLIRAVSYKKESSLSVIRLRNWR